MAKTLVIYAHPDVLGHCSTARDELLKQMKAHKEDFEYIDLYALKYDSILHEGEYYVAGNRLVSAQNMEFQKKITDAQNLIFIYPVWWSTMPAILKGWFDRVFTSGFAFRYNSWGIPLKLLKGRRALAILTTGAPRWATFLIMGDRSRKILSKDILGFCGIKTKVVYIAKCRKLDEKKATEIQQKVQRALHGFFGW